MFRALIIFDTSAATRLQANLVSYVQRDGI